MGIFKSIIIAFSLYSRIPMPVFTWQEKDMKHAISALPLIGAVIGGLSYGVFRLSMAFDIPVFCLTLFLSVLPLIVTGGFHMDGFMDVQDAKNSYQDKEKKLEIMKDPHIGAFAVISVSIFGMIWLSFFYLLLSKSLEKGDYKYLFIYMASFFFVRAICGLTSIIFDKAKKFGMLNTETNSTGSVDKVILLLEALCGIGSFLYFDIKAGIVCATALALFTVFYKHMCNKEFGGVTGDTAGYFVCMGEGIIVICLAVLSIIF
ncbi:adenosylcobinamide-GDP ribazoletransferase [Butyrivibrio sp. FC2001]|uniref:adenosylcobinamide-GDP ribazoletransferase n=1 Tax=Butyrivibrio sp. FC2001 TaxID=1280671 RepID=UPI0004206A47|nr:adenosylcobinamide-GDP ribazoletransferase [Butyrivibrio sp. FC2001]